MINDLISWYTNEFRTDPLYKLMEATTEGSPFHRERNVGVHTDMAIQCFLASITTEQRKSTDMIHIRNAFFALAFHDVGKPKARSIRYKTTTGVHYSFQGHDIISARAWENWAVTNWDMLKSRFSVSVRSIYAISWLIEHHQPWKIVKPLKVNNLVQSVLGRVSTPDIYTQMLAGDAYGRIYDDFETVSINTQQWLDDFKLKCKEAEPLPDTSAGKLLHVLIGASGSGKSTYTQANPLYKSFSLDRLRLQLYHPSDYTLSFAESKADTEFMPKVHSIFMDMVKDNVDIIIDNTNISKKHRAFYVQEARKKGYRIVAVLFPSAISTLLRRQQTRVDKFVPDSAVLQQYNNTSMPSYGEFDEVIVLSDNLHK